MFENLKDSVIFDFKDSYDMTDKIEESMKSNLISRIPMSKLGTGEDVANTVAFLSSDNASYITGETIHVNGGMYMAWQKLLINY